LDLRFLLEPRLAGILLEVLEGPVDHLSFDAPRGRLVRGRAESGYRIAGKDSSMGVIGNSRELVRVS